MRQREWTVEDENYIRENYTKISIDEICEKLHISKTSFFRKLNDLNIKKPRAQIGDIVNGWLITDIYIKDAGSQKISIAKIIAQEGEPTEKEIRLTKLTLHQISHPLQSRDRPDLSQRNFKHGLSGTRLHIIWLGLINRCNPKLSNIHKRYSGRGILLCEDWNDFVNFYNWAILNGYEEHLTLDRINNNGNYEPTNCKWSTYNEQAINKSNIDQEELDKLYEAFGESKNIYEWAIDPRCKCKLNNLKYRFNKGWDTERALTKPVQDQQSNLDTWLQEKYPDVYKEYIQKVRR